MLRNSLKLNQLIHSNHKSIKRLFSSQIIKTNDKLNKNEKQNQSSDKTEENIDKSVSEKHNNDIEKVVKSESYIMDTIWEFNQTYNRNKEYNKRTDPSYEAMQRINKRLEAMRNPGGPMKYSNFKKNFKVWIQTREENLQRYVSKRHAKLGPDLATANFVVVRGGKVMFKHAPDVWATHLDHFADKYDPRYKLIAVNGSGTKLRFEGIDNFQELDSLQVLDLSDNVLDDFSCDKIGRMFRNTRLSHLNLSNNPLITHRGIETLHRVRSLKKLKIDGTEAAKYPFLELLILSFNDLVPDCHIVCN